MIDKVKTGNGKTYKARAIAFFFRDEAGFEHYVGRVALIGDEYLYLPQSCGQEIRKENGEIVFVGGKKA